MPITSGIRVLIATAGTWGDLFPFIALGLELKARGHDVTVACSRGLSPWALRSGLNVVPFDGDFGKEEAQELAGNWNHWKQDPSRSEEVTHRALIRHLERNTLELVRHASTSDLLLTPSNCPEGKLVHDLTGTRWLSVIFNPQDGLRPVERTDPAFDHAMTTLRRRLGLSKRFRGLREYKFSEPTLFPCSKAIGQATDPSIEQTGFWFYEDPTWENWRPDQQLERFMNEGEPPLVLSFSSLPLEEPAKVLDVHVRAAQLLRRRLVVQQGWSGFSKEMLPQNLDPSQVHLADFIPHDWFFARAAALITHGGIGTLGRALRNACPVLVEPYGNDQFFNALRAKALGYGTAVHPLRLTAEGLARALQDKVLTPQARDRAGEAAVIIQQESGNRLACDRIESFVGKVQVIA